MKIILWIARIVAALIMLQTLYFKFTAAPESVYIFSTVGIEPWGRVGTGIIELIASMLILIPRTSIYGALLGLGIMAGAIFTHIFLLGIEVMNDKGELFYLAIITFISCLIVVYFDKNKLFSLIKNMFSK